jgi:CHAT domain-containing protein/tetratricopeptide (TPR) repeat protein
MRPRAKRCPSGWLYLVLLVAAACPRAGLAAPPADRLREQALDLQGQGQYAAAQLLYEQVLAGRRQALGERHPATAQSYRDLARCLGAQGRHAQALPLAERALQIRRRVLGEDHPDTAQSYHDLAHHLDQQGRFAQAQPLYQKALAIWRRVMGDEHPSTAAGYNSLAMNLNLQGRYAQAQRLFERALAIYRKQIGGHSDTAGCYNGLARNLAAQGKHAEALALYREVLAIRRKVLGEEHPDTARSYNSLAVCLHDQGKYAEAVPLYRKALAIRRQVLGDDHPDTVRTRTRLAVLLWQQGKVAEAVHLLQVSVPGQEAARLQAAASGFDRDLASQGSVHLLLAAGLARLGQPGNAYRHAELGLARGLLDDLAPADPGAGPRTVLQLARLRRVDAELLKLLKQEKLTQEQRRQRDALLARRRAIMEELSRKAAESSTGQVQSVERIQEHVPADGALVLWLDAGEVGEHRACVLRSNGAPVWLSLPGSGKGGAWARQDADLPARLFRALASPDSGSAERDRLIGAFRKQRLEPLKPHLQARGKLPAVRRLLVAPTRALALVPFEVTSDDYVVSYIPSGSVLVRLAQRRRALGASLLALGDPVFAGKGNQRLPGTCLEVQAIARLVPGSTTLLGSAASEQELDRLREKGKLKEFRLLHFATHAVIDRDRPEQSALILAQDRPPDPDEHRRQGKKVYDGRLTVGTVLREWDLNADLVVLRAGESGLGRQAAGGEPLGFARAFLSRGARAVVLSRWKVDDAAAALLMVRFYENLLGKRKGLKKGMGRAEALAEAKKWLRSRSRKQARGRLAALKKASALEGKPPSLPAGDRPFAHPCYWAAFVLIGDPS